MKKKLMELSIRKETETLFEMRRGRNSVKSLIRSELSNSSSRRRAARRQGVRNPRGHNVARFLLNGIRDNEKQGFAMTRSE